MLTGMPLAKTIKKALVKQPTAFPVHDCTCSLGHYKFLPKAWQEPGRFLLISWIPNVKHLKMAEILEGLSLSTSEKKQDPQNAYRQQYLMGTAGDMALPHYCSITLPPAKTSQKFLHCLFFPSHFQCVWAWKYKGSERTAFTENCVADFWLTVLGYQLHISTEQSCFQERDLKWSLSSGIFWNQSSWAPKWKCMSKMYVLVQVAPNTENPVPNISEELLIALFTALITSSVGTNSGKCTFWL